MRFLLLGIGLALSCGPALAVETVNYNNRSDTVVDVLSKSGLSTKYAVIHTAFTRRDAELQCSNYDDGNARKKACVKLDFEGGRRLAHDVRANCPAKTFTDFLGGRYRFVGERKNSHPGEYVVGNDAKFSIIDLKSGREETDGPTFYSTDLDIFRALCPRQAPPASAGYYLYPNP